MADDFIVDEFTVDEPDAASDFTSWKWRPSEDRFEYLDSDDAIYLRPASFHELLSWVHEEDRESLQQHWPQDVNGRVSAVFNFRVVDSSGELHHVAMRAKPQATANTKTRTYLIGTSWNVGMQFRRQQNQAQQIEKLEEFAATAAHDLKEPLRTVRGYCKLLKSDLLSKLSQSEIEDFATIELATERMQALLGSILSYSGLRGESLATEFVFSEAYEATLANISELVREKAAVISCSDELPVVSSNFQQTVQLLQNLVVNAIHAYEPGEVPVVEVKAVASARPAIQVIDHGRGISDGELQRIQRPFVRGENASYAGVGLGLAICRRLAAMNSIDMQIESSKGAGVVVTLAFPKLSQMSAA